jgi:hypothetical protein
MTALSYSCTTWNRKTREEVRKRKEGGGGSERERERELELCGE